MIQLSNSTKESLVRVEQDPRKVVSEDSEYRILASLDVEWTKNYRMKNGNIPFAWSVTWTCVPIGAEPGVPPTAFGYRSMYVENDSETQHLIDGADAYINVLLDNADFVIGHQLSSDLAVLQNASGKKSPSVRHLRNLWHGRRLRGSPRVVDSRYDIDSIATGPSRRLVDVCAMIHLDVTQPELGSRSMTALHRRWIHDQDDAARERISVLNLRHSLSSAFVAMRSLGLIRWDGVFNLNRLLRRELISNFEWVQSPQFDELV